MDLTTIHEYIHRFRVYIIIGLVGIIIILTLISRALNQNTTIVNESPSPTPTFTALPTITQVALPTTKTTLSPRQLLTRLTYPFKFEGLTVEMKHISKVMLIYYTGDEAVARESYQRLLQQLTLKEGEYKADFFPLDTPPLPREFDE